MIFSHNLFTVYFLLILRQVQISFDKKSLFAKTGNGGNRTGDLRMATLIPYPLGHGFDPGYDQILDNNFAYL